MSSTGLTPADPSLVWPGPQQPVRERGDGGPRRGAGGAERARRHQRDGAVAAVHAGPARRPGLYPGSAAALHLLRVCVITIWTPLLLHFLK